MATRGFSILKAPVDADQMAVDFVMLARYVQIRSTMHDEVLKELLKSSTETAERFLCLSLTERIITARWEELDTEELPYGPVHEILSVKDDQDNDVDYSRQGLFGSFITLKVDRLSPTIVRYRAGYNDQVPLPHDIKLAIMKLVTDDFEQRPSVSFEVVNDLPNNWKAKCRSYRRIPWTA